MRIAAVILVSTWSLPAFADDPSWHVGPSVAAGIEDLRYTEYAPTMFVGGKGPVLDTNTGVTPTARVDVDVTSPTARYFLRGSGAWTSGSTRYDGGVQNADGTITPISGPTTGYMIDFDVIAGVRRRVSRAVVVGGFVGLGYHRWDRDLRAIGDNSGYLEDYAWFHFQLGGRVEVTPAAGLHVALEASLLVPKGGSLAITHQPNGIDDANLELGLSLGERTRLVAAYSLAESIWVFAVAGIETDHITSSSSVPLTVDGQPVTNSSGQPLYILEPVSDTTRLTASVGAGYAF